MQNKVLVRFTSADGVAFYVNELDCEDGNLLVHGGAAEDALEFDPVGDCELLEKIIKAIVEAASFDPEDAARLVDIDLIPSSQIDTRAEFRQNFRKIA